MELVTPAAAAVKMGGENDNGVRRNNSTLTCAPIMADDIDQMLVLMNLAKSYGADLVEIRLDSLKPFLEGFNVRESIQTLVKLSPFHTLFTYRSEDSFFGLLFNIRNGFHDKNDNGVRRNNSTLICAPIMADTIDQMLVLMNLAKSYGADLVEIRLDSLKPFLEGFNVRESIQTLVKLSPLPTLFTYRSEDSFFDIRKWI